jgi:hypothetical protein
MNEQYLDQLSLPHLMYYSKLAAVHIRTHPNVSTPDHKDVP